MPTFRKRISAPGPERDVHGAFTIMANVGVSGTRRRCIHVMALPRPDRGIIRTTFSSTVPRQVARTIPRSGRGRAMTIEIWRTVREQLNAEGLCP
jgi:hypothetical protein